MSHLTPIFQLVTNDEVVGLATDTACALAPILLDELLQLVSRDEFEDARHDERQSFEAVLGSRVSLGLV